MEDRTQQALAAWLRTRAPHWRRTERLLRTQGDTRREDPEAVLELAQGLRALARDLALAQEVMPDGRTTRQLQALFARAHEVVYRRPQNVRLALLELVRDEVPRVIRHLRGPILAVSGLFLLGILSGWLLVATYPELAALFASPDMIDLVQRGELWTDGLLNVLPSSVLSVAIMANNITVSLVAFVLGAFYGLGTLYIIGLNGLMLGGVFALTAQHGLAGRLFEFVVAHGVVELSAIVLAGAAGVQLGEALARPGPQTRLKAFQAAVSEAGALLVVVVPFLAVAGLIEGFVSPDPAVPFAARLLVGLLSGALFWWVLSGRVWRRT